MTFKTLALQADSSKDKFKITEITRRDLGDNDVKIKVQFAGICHSDIHTARGEWPGVKYPCVPGHEIVGEVEATGSKVSKIKVGDTVGVGCFVNSCNDCQNCKDGNEQFCVKGVIQTYNSLDKDGTVTLGGYSQDIVVNEDFVLEIPKNLDKAQTTPLLCAGITMYNPLKKYNAGPGKKVAFVGLGGLGHVGVKIAAAMGAEVTVFSQSLKKMEDGLKLGATHYYATSEPETITGLVGQYDLIINTVTSNPNVNLFLSLLKPNGALVLIGLPDEQIKIDARELIMGDKILTGSIVGGIELTQEMLDFCGEKNIGAEIELIGVDKVNEAYDRTVASDVRYRFVIDTSTFSK